MKIDLIEFLKNNTYAYIIKVNNISLDETHTKSKKLAKIYYKNVVKNKGKLISKYREDIILKTTIME